MIKAMKYKNDEIMYKEIVGILNLEDMTIEVESEIVDLAEDLKNYNGCDISIKLRKEI